MVASMQRNAWRNLRQAILVAGITFFVIWLEPSNASAEITIDLTYDSVMDMVRPEQHPGIRVHHNLQIVFSGRTVVENRDRNTKNLSDRNAMDQDLGGGEESATYVSWRVETNTRLVRTQRDPQSTRTMTVTLTPGNACHLEVTDKLNPGFSEYAFLRISTHTLGYFSSYRVIRTSCSIQ